MTSRCHCSDCRISSKLFPRNCEGRIVLPHISGRGEQPFSANQSCQEEDGGTSSGSMLSSPITTGTHHIQDDREQTMNMIPTNRTVRKRTVSEQSKPTSQSPRTRNDNPSTSISEPSSEPFPAAIHRPSAESPPLASEFRTEFCSPVLAPQTEAEMYNVGENGKPVRIRWNSRKSRQDFTLQASDGPKSRFRHYNAECT